MKYLSVCSGIEAATVAWHHMGWIPVAFSEIEKFPSAVLAHHYPNVPNLGDMTKYKVWNLNGTIDILVGGTPCQSFSVAGLRKGLEDPRGNLALTYVGILDKFRPKWFIWENVPGVLSSGGGRDFGSFLGAVAELGYGFAYRVLDAQYFGVAQRRRRVFVVGCLGDWRSAAEVLFESESLCRDIKPSREKRKETTANSGIGVEITGPLAARRFAETDGISEISAQMIAVPNLANCLQTTSNDYSRADGFNMIAYRKSRRAQSVDDYETWVDDGKANTINTFDLGDIRTTHAVAYSVREDAKANTFSATELEVSNALGALRPSPQSHHAQVFVAQPMAVRRLTPIECERLQGFPDNYTDIKPKGKDTPDGPRYKALGNSMAVPCMKWIGEGIDMIENP